MGGIPFATGTKGRGAEKALEVANEHDCSLAILKERSPSCGSGEIYDGTFTGTKVTV